MLYLKNQKKSPLMQDQVAFIVPSKIGLDLDFLIEKNFEENFVRQAQI